MLFFPREELLDDNKRESSSNGGLFWRVMWPSPARFAYAPVHSLTLVGASFDNATENVACCPQSYLRSEEIPRWGLLFLYWSKHE